MLPLVKGFLESRPVRTGLAAALFGATLLLVSCSTGTASGPTRGAVSLVDITQPPPGGGCPNCGWNGAFGVFMLDHYCCCLGRGNCITVRCGEPCPLRAPDLGVDLLGPTRVRPESSCVWVASIEGGVFPFSYEWKVGGEIVGTDFRVRGAPPSSSPLVSVTVTDGLERSVEVTSEIVFDPDAPPCEEGALPVGDDRLTFRQGAPDCPAMVSAGVFGPDERRWYERVAFVRIPAR
jgi:hypothetical protein